MSGQDQSRLLVAILVAGDLDLIYVSPERFAMPEFMAILKSSAGAGSTQGRRLKLSFVAIDEAHCISEWGHDFRPDYLNLSTLVREFPDVPVAAFTATATHRVQEDIVSKLGLRSPHTVRASFNRPNLFYKVVPKEKPGEQILQFVRAHAGESTATSAPISRDRRRLFLRPSGTSPFTILWARPSAMAVLPTPGSPMRTGLLLVRRERTCITRRIS